MKPEDLISEKEPFWLFTEEKNWEELEREYLQGLEEGRDQVLKSDPSAASCPLPSISEERR